ncbi:MAG: flagellar hook-length control protein FliK, partial [Pseudomonadota bacterium]
RQALSTPLQTTETLKNARVLVSALEAPALDAGEALATSLTETNSKGREAAITEASPARPERALSQSISNQIAQVVRGNGSGRFEISLDPPELGRVTVTLTTTGDSVSASIASERPEIGDMLRRHNEMLHRELSNAGFKNVSLDFGFKNQQGENHDFQRQATHQSDGSEPADERSAGRAEAALVSAGMDLRI